MKYQIRFKNSAYKELFKLPKDAIRRISLAIDELENNPRPMGGKKLKGSEVDLWRIRVGNYRVIYMF